MIQASIENKATSVDKKLLRAIAEFVALSMIALLVPAILAVDIFVFRNHVSEVSLTEISQETLLLISAILFAVRAYQRPESRAFLVLAAGFFTCMFVRELDAFLDQLIFHGFWFWPTLCIAASAIVYAWTCRDTFAGPMLDFIGTRSQLYMTFGLVAVLVLSRVLGSGDLLWKHVVSESDYILVKTALQEGLELYGYIYVCCGACLFPASQRRSQTQVRSLNVTRDAARSAGRELVNV